MIGGYDDTPGQVVWGMMVQNKKYTEHRRPPQNGGATTRESKKKKCMCGGGLMGIITLKMMSAVGERPIYK